MIEITNLTKSYGPNKGVFDLSFNVNQGEVFGYLGPNGAGKTTTIRNLLGFIHPDKGSCVIDGLDCHKDAATIQKKLGYLPGEIAFFDDMTGDEFLRLMAQMRGLKDTKRQSDLINLLTLDTKGYIRKMSKGMKQKLGLVCAFMHNPDILILDEPTSGLDPLMQSIFVELIMEQKALGKTVLMSSHSFEEIERTCDRAGIIREGRLVAVENIQTLKAERRKIYQITFQNPEEAKLFAKDYEDVVEVSGQIVDAAVSGEVGKLIKVLATFDVVGLDVVNQSLEDVFMHYYNRSDIDD
ncbi:MAG: ABC transporter ATP-binding protein [Sphaerochaeta sp.]